MRKHVELLTSKEQHQKWILNHDVIQHRHEWNNVMRVRNELAASKRAKRMQVFGALSEAHKGDKE